MPGCEEFSFHARQRRADIPPLPAPFSFSKNLPFTPPDHALYSVVGRLPFRPTTDSFPLPAALYSAHKRKKAALKTKMYI